MTHLGGFSHEDQTKSTLMAFGLPDFGSTPMQVYHTLAHVEHTRPDTVFLCYQLSGKSLSFRTRARLTWKPVR